MKNTNLIILASDGKNTLVKDLKCKIISRIRDIGFMANELPVLKKEVLLLELKKCIACIAPSRQTFVYVTHILISF